MRTKPYLIISDTHYHPFAAYASTDERGVNSRLQITIDETLRAANELQRCGGNLMIHAGDWFHTRGSVDPVTLNLVLDCYRLITMKGIRVVGICGNHDLMSKESSDLTNMAQALTNVGVEMITKPTILKDPKIALIPWYSNLDSLREQAAAMATWDHDLIIHAPVDDVIVGLPNHGLSAAEIGEWGYRNVFAGHYHNHKRLRIGVYSVGALCHQTWGDIGSRAGFVIVQPDGEVEHVESSAPKFIEINDEGDLSFAKGNYVRWKAPVEELSQAETYRDELLNEYGAAGAMICPVKVEHEPAEGRIAPTSIDVSFDKLIDDFIQLKSYSSPSQLSGVCRDILLHI